MQGNSKVAHSIIEPDHGQSDSSRLTPVPRSQTAQFRETLLLRKSVSRCLPNHERTPTELRAESFRFHGGNFDVDAHFITDHRHRFDASAPDQTKFAALYWCCADAPPTGPLFRQFNGAPNQLHL